MFTKNKFSLEMSARKYFYICFIREQRTRSQQKYTQAIIEKGEKIKIFEIDGEKPNVH